MPAKKQETIVVSTVGAVLEANGGKFPAGKRSAPVKVSTWGAVLSAAKAKGAKSDD